MATFTGAWSHVPVAAGSVGLTSTVIVGLEDPELLLDEEELLLLLDEEAEPLLVGGVVATVPTDETTPGVVWLLGRGMATRSPTATSDCWLGSSAMETWRTVEVADRTAP